MEDASVDAAILPSSGTSCTQDRFPRTTTPARTKCSAGTSSGVCRPAVEPLSVERDASAYLQVARCGVDGGGYSDLHRLLVTDLSLLARLRPADSGARDGGALSSPRVGLTLQVTDSL